LVKNLGTFYILMYMFILGVINVLTTTPLWVVNTRLKMKGVGVTLERNNNNKYTTLYGTLAFHIKTIFASIYLDII